MSPLGGELRNGSPLQGCEPQSVLEDVAENLSFLAHFARGRSGVIAEELVCGPLVGAISDHRQLTALKLSRSLHYPVPTGLRWTGGVHRHSGEIFAFFIAASPQEFLMFSRLRRPRANRPGRSVRLRETRTQCECASSPDLESFSTSTPPTGCPRCCATLIGKGSGSSSLTERSRFLNTSFLRASWHALDCCRRHDNNKLQKIVSSSPLLTVWPVDRYHFVRRLHNRTQQRQLRGSSRSLTFHSSSQWGNSRFSPRTGFFSFICNFLPCG